MHIAAANGSPDVVQLLIDADGDPHAKDRKHQLTPYDLAAGGYHFDIEGKLTKRSDQLRGRIASSSMAAPNPAINHSNTQDPIARVTAILAPFAKADSTPKP